MFFLILALFALVGGALAVLAIQNLASQAQLTVFTWHTPALPVGLLILFAFLLGALLLYLISVFSALRDQRETRQLRKRVSELEQQLATPVAAAAPPAFPDVSMQSTAPIIPMPGMNTTKKLD